jgi:hypothetical protein
MPSRTSGTELICKVSLISPESFDNPETIIVNDSHYFYTPNDICMEDVAPIHVNVNNSNLMPMREMGVETKGNELVSSVNQFTDLDQISLSVMPSIVESSDDWESSDISTIPSSADNACDSDEVKIDETSSHSIVSNAELSSGEDISLSDTDISIESFEFDSSMTESGLEYKDSDILRDDHLKSSANQSFEDTNRLSYSSFSLSSRSRFGHSISGSSLESGTFDWSEENSVKTYGTNSKAKVCVKASDGNVEEVSNECSDNSDKDSLDLSLFFSNSSDESDFDVDSEISIDEDDIFHSSDKPFPDNKPANSQSFEGKSKSQESINVSGKSLQNIESNESTKSDISLKSKALSELSLLSSNEFNFIGADSGSDINSEVLVSNQSDFESFSSDS